MYRCYNLNYNKNNFKCKINMGTALSVNIANEMVNAMVSDNNSIVQSCSQDVTQIQEQIFKNVSKVGPIYNNWNQYSMVKSNCIQQSSIQNQISQKTVQSAEQIAKSIAQQFQLSSSAAVNLTNLSASLAVAVSNSFNQTCNTNVTQSQFQLIDGVDQIVGVYNNWNQYNQLAADCVQKDQAVNTIQQQIQQQIQQSATATVENSLAVILGMIFAIFAVIGIIYFISMYYKRPQQTQQSQSDIDTEIASLITAQKLSSK
jgi:hypothetical protein